MLWLKTLHVVCAVLWLGNFAVTGLWSVRAFAARNDVLAAFATREILFTDAVFTAAFGTAVTLSGIALALHDGVALWSTFWTRTALETVIAAGAVWLFVLLPLEIRMRALAAGRGGATLRRAFVAWNVIGWTVTVALFWVIYLMVARPV
ncbi:MAG: DUF2269 domain-containing protein [Candidatus Eremiobacteraeota bacterium]|nr:DUF2269 domain-containing protein [Candidatus Eremiobacteraeota bacterium]